MTTEHSTQISIEQVAELSARVIQEVEKTIVGKREVLEQMMAAFLSPGGHILLEDYPGLAKTLIANSFASALGMQFKRIQFTPDLLPGDITGGYVFESDQNRFMLRKGPIFTHILLADEINRASPKTQSAPLVGGRVLRPESSHDFELLFHAGAAGMEVDVEGAVLALVPADANAEHEAA